MPSSGKRHTVPAARSGNDGDRSGSPERVPLVVNGECREVLPGSSLLTTLRDELGLTGAKPGCGEGECGACTVLVDGRPVLACRQVVGSLAGREVTTIEGLAQGRELHPVQQAFAEVGAAQCGYCTPGMVLGVVALLASDPSPDAATVVGALDGHVCRCGAYLPVRRAVDRAAQLAAGPARTARQGWSGQSPEAGPATAVPAAGDPETDIPVADDPAAGDPVADDPCLTLVHRPRRPWDLTAPDERDWSDPLGPGLVVVLPPPPSTPGSWRANGGAWLHVDPGGTATAFTGKVDVGQDNRTALRLLVAEELGVPLGQVRLHMGDTDLCPYDRGTFASRSMPDAGEDLRRVAAHARTLLRHPGPADDPVVPTTRVRVQTVDARPPVTPPGRWHTAGRPHLPGGLREVVTGSRRYVSDLSLPDMRHGAVLRPPVPGASVRRADTRRAEARPGVRVVRYGSILGVVAPDPVSARAALADVEVTWDLPDVPPESELAGFLRSHPADVPGWGGRHHEEVGLPDAALASAPLRLAATYTTAYIAHAPLETRAALAVWGADGRLTVWTGTQTPFPVRTQLATVLDLPEHDVRVVVPPTGGAFGGKHGADVAVEAAMLARVDGAPVKVVWSRHDEFIGGTLRPAAVIDVDAGATAEGELLAWAFTNVNSGAAALAAPYRIPHLRLDYRPARSPLRQGSYRALAAVANNFARECHVDELAHRAGVDPVELRLRNLADDRLAGALRAAAARFGWEAGAPRTGRGIACGLEKEARVATAVQVEVDDGGAVRVLRVVTAYDCGAVVNPETVRNQIEGGTVMALGGALFEAVHFAGEITNGTFSRYRVPRMGDVPPIDVEILDRPDVPPAGAGETPLIALAPAIASAVFDATGRRIRTLPLTADGRLDRGS